MRKMADEERDLKKQFLQATYCTRNHGMSCLDVSKAQHTILAKYEDKYDFILKICGII